MAPGSPGVLHVHAPSLLGGHHQDADVAASPALHLLIRNGNCEFKEVEKQNRGGLTDSSCTQKARSSNSSCWLD